MPSITKYQRDYCIVAQLYQALDSYSYVTKFAAIHILKQIDDVNLKVLSNKQGTSLVIGGTPLHIAAFHKHFIAFDCLLSRRADFTIQNKFGCTALHGVFIDLFSQSNNTPNTTTGTIDNEFINLVLTSHIDFGDTKNPKTPYGLSHFHIACAANYVAAVKLFLDAGESLDESVKPNTSLFPGYTPMHFATRFCGYGVAKLLLDRGADLGARDSKGLTPLHLNIERNIILKRFEINLSRENAEYRDKSLEESQKITSLLLNDERLMDVDRLGFCKTHAACTLADTSLAERFLQEVDVNHVINMDSPLYPGYTYLHLAARSNAEIVKLLLRKGANIEIKDAKEIMPIDLCRRNFQLEDLCRVLSIVPGAEDIFFSDKKTKLLDFIYAMNSRSTFESFIQMSPKNIFLPLNSPLWPGHSLAHLLVHFSSVFGDDKTVLFLDSNTMIQQDAHGRSPIHLAFYKKNIKLVDLLLENRPEIIDAVDSNGLSHLLIACDRENTAVVQTLLSRDINPNVNVVYKGKTLSSIVKNRSTPLHVAVSRRSIEIITLLIKCGANANAIDAKGITPIHRLIQTPTIGFGESEIIKQIGELLLSSCDLKNLVSKTGLSHLHVAIYSNNEKAVESLLKLGANANAVASHSYRDTKSFPIKMCSTKCTPLDFYLRNGNKKLLELLLQAGADILYKKPNGMTLFYDILTKSIVWESNSECISRKTLWSIFANNLALQKRAEDSTGLTLLHVACYLRDAEQIQRLLDDSRVDVNAQLFKNSVIWAKDTPLHLLIKSNHKIENLQGTIELLLKRGSDVTMVDINGDSPAHSTWWKEYYSQGDHSLFSGYIILRLLLKYQRDFTVNPTNGQGISHFHLVCLVGESAIAEQFLKNGVDVNLPIDYFNWKMTSKTPLLFMMGNNLDPEVRLQTIDVLFKYGADINAQDEGGSTALLIATCLRSPRELYFKKLCEAGADINCINLNGGSVLENLFKAHYPITKDELQFFFAYSHLFNMYNSIYGTGVIPLTLYRSDLLTPDRSYVLDSIMKVPSLFTVNPDGRTPIHNIAAKCVINIPSEVYTHYIERFMEMGYDIDAQDLEGKTALHLAANYSNARGLSGLLSAGADINLADNLERTPLTVQLNFCFESVIAIENSKQVKNVLVLHIFAMLLCDLEVNSKDLKFIEPKLSEEQFTSYAKEVSRELKMSEMVTIGTGSMTLRDFLSETGAVASRPSMASETDRQAVDKLLQSIDFGSFPNIKGLIKLQNKKILTRLSMMQVAADSVRRLIGSVNGFSMPEICCRLILRFLSNTRIKFVIESVSREN